MNIPLILGIGLSAQPVSGCDIGGFCAAWQGQIVDSQMLTRWTIMGAFLPWFRNHYDNYYKPYQEPYRYPEPVPTICLHRVAVPPDPVHLRCHVREHTDGQTHLQAPFHGRDQTRRIQQ